MQEPLDRQSLDAALARWQEAYIISEQQAAAIRELESTGVVPLAASSLTRQRDITPSTLVISIGAFLVLVASVVFVGLGWTDMGHAQQFMWGTLAVVVPWLAAFLMRRTRQPLALQASCYLAALGSVALILFFYTLFRLTGWWPDDSFRREDQETQERLLLFAQCTTVIASAIFAFRLSAPWMLALAGGVGWIGWSQLIDLYWRPGPNQDGDLWQQAIYGAILIVLGLAVTRIGLRQHAFWLFLVGLMSAFVFLGIDAADDALGPIGITFLVMALTAIAVSIWLEFRIFLIFGALGLYGWVSALVIETFGGSRPVAFGLILLGAGIVVAGIAWQRWLAHRVYRRGNAPPA